MIRAFELSIVWDADFPVEVRFLLGELGLEHLAATLLPRWVEEVRIRWYPDLEAVAECTVQEDYRGLVLRFSPKVLEQPDRRRLIVHELMHAYNVPIAVTLRNALKHVEGKAAQDVLDELVTKKVEESTCDLADLICRLLEQ